MARRISILAKLLAAYLVPTIATFAGFGLLAHVVATRALEAELGARLTSMATAAALAISDESLDLLQAGDEETRTYRNLSKRLGELRQATGVERIFVFAADGTSRADTRKGVPIGQRYFGLEAHRAEVRAALGGTPTASVLFRGRDGVLYKSGFAPMRDAGGQVRFGVGVDGAASFYTQLAGFRRTLLAVGTGGALVVVALSVLVARLLVRPLQRLEAAASRIGRGDLEEPVQASSRDEVGLVAETMEAMRRQLRQRDERMQMMLAGIAHEVRNPLGGLQLYAGLLREDLAEAPEQLDHVRRIERELEHLKVIVAEFLEYARRPRPDQVPVDVATVLTEVRDLAIAAAQPRGVALELEAVRAEVTGDAGQLRRALLNLAHNAVQACPADGTGRVRLRCARAGGLVQVSIEDSGPGVAADLQDRIWSPFFTTKQSGTGLGLAFARDIARDHGGQLEVESPPGRGATFTLKLPESP